MKAPKKKKNPGHQIADMSFHCDEEDKEALNENGVQTLYLPLLALGPTLLSSNVASPV